MFEALIPMVLGSTMFAMIFGIVYLKSRENMAMIEKGMDPKIKDNRPRPFVNLKWGLLLIGSGLGLFLAFMIDRTMLPQTAGKGKSGINIPGINIQGHHRSVKKEIIIKHDTNDTNKGAAVTKVDSAGNDKPENANDEDTDMLEINGGNSSDNVAIYFALIGIGGGLGLFFSYRIEKKEWLDKKGVA